MKLLRGLGVLLLGAAVGVALWWLASPWWTLWEIKAAAERRDYSALASHIDFPALGEDLRGQIAHRIGSTQAPIRLAGLIVRGALADGEVAALTGPEAMRSPAPRRCARSCSAARWRDCRGSNSASMRATCG